MRLHYASGSTRPTTDAPFISLRKFLWSIGCTRPHQCSLQSTWGKVGNIAYRKHSPGAEEFVTLACVADDFGIIATKESHIPRYTSFDGKPIRSTFPRKIER